VYLFVYSCLLVCVKQIQQAFFIAGRGFKKNVTIQLNAGKMPKHMSR